MEEYDVQITVERALEKFPSEKPRLISDNGSQYVSRDFAEFLRMAGLQLAGKKGKPAILDEFCKEKSRQLHSLASVSQKRHCSCRGKELDYRSSIHRLPTS